METVNVTMKCKKLEGCNQDQSPPHGDLTNQAIIILASFSYREERWHHGLMVQRGAYEHNIAKVATRAIKYVPAQCRHISIPVAGFCPHMISSVEGAQELLTAAIAQSYSSPKTRATWQPPENRVDINHETYM